MMMDSLSPAAQGSEASPAARNTLDSSRIPRASKLLICGLFQKGRVLAQDGDRSQAKRYFVDIIMSAPSSSPT